MKKLATIIISIVLLSSLSNAFASIRVSQIPNFPYTNDDYVGVIVAAQYIAKPSNGENEIMIFTLHDEKDTQNTQLTGLTLKLNESDLPFGLTLASAIGKKIQVVLNDKYDIHSVTIITDEYYYGDQARKLKLTA